ncbi:reverse transcriptase domain-containing protein [Tanacetum coccineum]
MARVDVDTLTMEQYLALSQENQAPGVGKPKIRGNVNFKIKSQFMRELREDTFSGNKDEDAYDHIDRGPIPGMRPVEALTAIQTMADHSQKWHDDTTSRNIRSSSSKDGLDCPINEEVKQVDGEFGRTSPFNGNNRGKFRVGPPGYYTKIDNHPPYGKKRQSLEELLVKHHEKSARRSTKMEVWIKKLQKNAGINTRNQSASLKNLETQIEQLTKELRSRKEKSEQAKVVTVEHEGPSSPKKLTNLHGISFLSDSQEENTNDQLLTKEANPGHFTLPCTIGNFNLYAMADLGASVNVLPRNIFEYLELTNLSETEMLVEMADMRKKAPLGIVRDILVKIDKFLFPSDFVILDQIPNSTVILGRPFLATVHAQISVFEKEISVRIGDERVTFNINRNDRNFAPTERIFMLNSVDTNEPINKRLKISDDTTTTHFCKPIIQEYDKDFKAWPSCNLFKNKCDGGHEIYRINKLGKTKYWFFPNNYERKEMKRDGVENSVWSKRYSEWCNENSHDKKPRPRDYTFKEWVKLKKGHLDVSKSVRKDFFRLWVIDQFTKALDPYKDRLERWLDEYNWVLHKEIEQLADEYEMKIGEKGQVLEEIWTKCKRTRCKNKDWWENNENLSLGRKNGSRFRKMIIEEMEEVLGNDKVDSDNETIQKPGGNYRDWLDS